MRRRFRTNPEGTVVIDPRGYRKVKRSGHPRANSCGYVYEHLLVAEQKIGRPLVGGDCVHHLNGDKGDNNPENVIVCASSVEHLRYHQARWSDDQVVAIRELYATRKLSLSEVGQRFGVSLSAISLVVRGETFRGIGGPISRSNPTNRYTRLRMADELEGHSGDA